MKAPVKLSLDLDLSRETDSRAYQILRSLESPAERKAMILSFATKKQRRKTFLFLSIFSVIVSALLILLSTHFTYDFQLLVMPRFWAFLLSFAIVLFTSFALTIASYTTGATHQLFRVLWVIGILYSIFTAFAGQYNSFRSYNATEVVNDTDLALTALNNQLESLELQKQAAIEGQTPYKKLIDELSESPEKKTEYPQTWKDANARFDSFQDKIDSLNEQILSVQNQITEASISSSRVEHQTVYSWLAELLHLKAEFIEFIILMLPSIFIDLASSLLLKFALGKTPVVTRKR